MATDTGLVTESGLAVSIRRNRGLDGILDAHNAQDVDEVRKVEVVSNNVSEMFETYDMILREIQENDEIEYLLEKFYFVRGHVTEILTNDEINSFLNATQNYEDRPEYSMITGMVVSQLIQNNYSMGGNDFVINVHDFLNVDYLGYCLEGMEGRPLNITFNGNLGKNCGRRVKYSNIRVNGNTEHSFGGQAENSIFYIDGDTDGYLGISSDNSTYVIQGDVGYASCQHAKNSEFEFNNADSSFGAKAENCTFAIKGGADRGFLEDAKNCTVKITDKFDLEGRPYLNSGNHKVYLIDSNMNERLIIGTEE